MYALSLAQPFASLTVCGLKPYEVRSWRTHIRDTIAIHASARIPAFARQWWEGLAPDVLDRYARGLRLAYKLDFDAVDLLDYLPRGQVIGVATLADCVTRLPRLPEVHLRESVGPFPRDHFGFKWENPCAWRTGIPAKGAVGLWHWERP